MAAEVPATEPIAQTEPVSQTEAVAQTAPTSDLLHLRALSLDDIPPNESLSNASTSQTTAAAFVSRILEQGRTFAEETLEKKFKSKGGSKKSEGSAGNVELLVWDRPGEAWFARRSKHEDKSEAGTASWAEFDAGLREQHSEHERDYTPGVMDAHKVCEWDNLSAEGWDVVGLEVYEMAHKIPVFNNRFFPVIVATARSAVGKSLLVVQVPVDLQKSDGAKYSIGKGGKAVQGMYVSIEYARALEDGTIVWEMATASDAKGALPMPVQKLGIPGAIIKDVGLFLTWAEQNRRNK